MKKNQEGLILQFKSTDKNAIQLTVDNINKACKDSGKLVSVVIVSKNNCKNMTINSSQFIYAKGNKRPFKYMDYVRTMVIKGKDKNKTISIGEIYKCIQGEKIPSIVSVRPKQRK